MPSQRPGETPGPDWLVRAALIARRYYLEDRSKTQIAEETGLSRFKVARILDQARDLGLVRVSVQLPARIEPDLSSRLRERFGLRRSIVVDCVEQSPAHQREELSRVAADLLAELVEAEDVLGLTCSRTIALASSALTRLAPCPVVQLSGTLAGPDVEAGSVESVRRAAFIGGGKAYPMYAPMVLPDPATTRALAGQPAIRQALDQFGHVSVAMVAIGAWEPEFSTVWESVSAEERTEAAERGAVGEIAARLFDASGAAVRTGLDERVLGVRIDQLRDIPEVIGLAYNVGRAPAVRALLTGGVVDSLVCDDVLARALLAEAAVRDRGPGVVA